MKKPQAPRTSVAVAEADAERIPTKRIPWTFARIEAVVRAVSPDITEVQIQMAEPRVLRIRVRAENPWFLQSQIQRHLDEVLVNADLRTHVIVLRGRADKA